LKHCGGHEVNVEAGDAFVSFLRDVMKG